MALCRSLTPNRCLDNSAATPFIVCGHRLSSLFRALSSSRFTSIGLKVLKKLRKQYVLQFEYLWNNEALAGQPDA